MLEYDEVMDQQRKNVYGYRQKVLGGTNCKDLILDMIDRQIREHIDVYLGKSYGPDSYAEWAGEQLSVELQGKDFVGVDEEQADLFAREEAARKSERLIADAIDENLPESEEEVDWNWGALAAFVNSRWRTKLLENELKAFQRDEMFDRLSGDRPQGDRRCRHERRRSLSERRFRAPLGLRVDPRQVRHQAEPR
ncbi:MAG: hypothetical protein QM811_30810 [Pirellulales bacterium]